MKSPVLAILGVLLCHINFTNQIKNGFVCQPVEDSCAPPQAPVMQGRRGKIGPKGVKGELGEAGAKGHKGSSGVVDYGRVNAAIKSIAGDLVAERVSSLERTIQKMKETIANTKEEAFTAYKWCKYRYKGKCYRALVNVEYDIPYQTCLEFCKEWGMKPADITGPEMFKKLARYIATEIPPEKNHAHLVIGMSYNPANQKLKFNNGSLASFVKWYRGYPKSDSDRTRMGIVVRKNPINAQGMFNLNPGNKQGILCQK